MIKFIDKNTGNVFNGSKPFVHWFDGKQSIGLNYDKQFIVISDSESIDVSLDSEVFFLIDNQNPNHEKHYDKDYINLDDLKTNHLYIEYNEENPKPYVFKYNGFYVYTFNIVSQGKYVGEIRDTFTINEEEFTIGVDFIDENEALGINLANFGAEISNEVQRAIYEKDINEQLTDYILLNRKFKELLNEYINILANKGSYKSLINSLNWFEYGDIVKIYEYWKHGEPNQSYLSKRDLTQFVNSETENLLFTNSKTTYVGISAALNKVTIQDGEIVYEDKYTEISGNDPQMVDEPNPELEDVSLLWSKLEMSLKMTLLGNFFATYFLPIHLDLIHSTIENVVYASTLKITSIPKLERIDIHDEINEIRCDVDKRFHLSNIETFTNLSTPFGFINDENLNEEDEVLQILGVDTEFNNGKTIDDLKAYSLQHFKGIGVIVPFNCEIRNVTGSAIITDADIKIYKDGSSTPLFERHTDRFNHTPVEGKVNTSFNLLIREIGSYKVQLQFRRSDGVTYIKVIEFEVDGDNYQKLTMYKLVPRYPKNEINLFTIKEWMQSNDSVPLQFGNIADFVLNPVQALLTHYDETTSNEPKIVYSQFISTTKEAILNTVHANQVIIIECGNSIPNVKIGSKNTGFEETLIDIIQAIDSDTGISAIMPDVVWIAMDRFGNIIHDDEGYPIEHDDILVDMTDGQTRYYIGINRQPIYDGNPNYCEYKIVSNGGAKCFVREMFIPYLYKLEHFGEITQFEAIAQQLTEEEIFQRKLAEDTYVLNKTDVVCFLPELRCVRRPSGFMWKYICQTTNEEITPLSFRPKDENVIPTILQPLFGRYDFKILPSAGYYDILFKYKMDDNQDENITKTVASQFIISKN